jgi:hypothetical protein
MICAKPLMSARGVVSRHAAPPSYDELTPS